VTGGAGWIGKAVCRELTSRGSIPVPFDSSTGQDVRRLADVHDAMHDVDAVINLAGVLGTAETIGRERQPVEVNVLGALNVFQEAAERGLPVVHIGTGHRGQLNPYAVTKACAEDLALTRASYGGEPIVVVRAFHAYGPGQKMCPPHGTAPVRKIVPSFVCRALTGMPIEVNGSGQQVIDLVHVDDVARVLVDALDGPYGTVIDAGTGKHTTVLQAAWDVIAACRSDSEIVHLPMRPGEPQHSVVVADTPACPNPWPYRLRETVAWYRKALGQ
jgi:UDP-glucose 4-epimerase